MILIFGPYPTPSNEKDGLVQRVKTIDTFMANSQRIYISNIVDKHKQRIKNTRTVTCIDYFGSFLLDTLYKRNISQLITIYKHIFPSQLPQLMKSAKTIYIHSLHSAVRIPIALLEKFSHKIIFDIHGCVVEELDFNDEPMQKILKYEAVERIIFTHISKVICVSKNMEKFYRNKYPQTTTEFILLPILSERCDYEKKTNSSKVTIIYSGGTQKWQNVDLMVETINKLYHKYNFIILTHNADDFKKNINKEALLHTEIKSVSSDEVPFYYKKAHLGFILREHHIVNTISCPTKLIEYISHGIVPIVLQPEIGDFNDLGYKYFLLSQIKNETNKAIITDKKKQNIELIEQLKKTTSLQIKNFTNSFIP